MSMLADRASVVTDGVTSVKSNVVKTENLEVDENGFTERVLLSLVVDISMLHETVERVRVQVYALAKQHGVDPVKT